MYARARYSHGVWVDLSIYRPLSYRRTLIKGSTLLSSSKLKFYGVPTTKKTKPTSLNSVRQGPETATPRRPENGTAKIGKSKAETPEKLKKFKNSLKPNEKWDKSL